MSTIVRSRAGAFADRQENCGNALDQHAHAPRLHGAWRIDDLQGGAANGKIREQFNQRTGSKVGINIADRFQRDTTTVPAPLAHQSPVVHDAAATHRNLAHGTIDKERPFPVDILLQFRQMLECEAPVLDPALASSKRTVEIFLKRLKHALDEDWTLENMAAECNLSRTQFTQHCQVLTNMTPVRHLQMLRLNAARHLLESGQKSVTNVAYDCGFSSSQYFATCYKKRFGFSPVETPRQQTMMSS